MAEGNSESPQNSAALDLPSGSVAAFLHLRLSHSTLIQVPNASPLMQAWWCCRWSQASAEGESGEAYGQSNDRRHQGQGSVLSFGSWGYYLYV